ncbi:hypothetical protein TTE0467 [Caldanaerobacter subterraneus subsp. tengcongensis MB4]|uniref:Uncharacterized protein n=1 Tax=Caldanaerobacter subterraneus subsp. tengcongensis (strain DSM 15242 / JCM 11007 / NBRC 100824 / MB4) TaxID=273068 RepID=Q8RCG2_CALS4|nr:hypothetical protein TTE0467 [Caldanaerobacter subterraneus subsp. tengcongensis MB4]
MLYLVFEGFPAISYNTLLLIYFQALKQKSRQGLLDLYRLMPAYAVTRRIVFVFAFIIYFVLNFVNNRFLYLKDLFKRR